MRLFVIVILLVLLQSCSSEAGIPKDILQPEKMKIVLLDMLRTDEYINLHVVNDSLSIKRKKWYQKVLGIHKISKQDFQKSIYFYEANPNIFKEILNSMHYTMRPAINDKTKDSLKLQ